MEVTRDVEGRPVKIRMRKPADMHHHFRAPKSAMFKIATQHVPSRFALAVAMPNLIPPITTFQEMEEYYRALVEALASSNGTCQPLMTLYLTDTLDPKEVERCCAQPYVVGVKYYPGGKPGVELTTGSGSGVTNPSALFTPGTQPYEILRVLDDHGKVLLMHGADGFAYYGPARFDETSYEEGEELSPDHQEQHFITATLPRIIDAHPSLKKTVEHLSTKEGAAFLSQNGGKYLGCSLTYQHLGLDDRDLFRGGFNPYRSWIPKIQKKEDREALRALAKADRPFVWLGSDSAPHPRGVKESLCCKGGVFTAHAGLELYVEAFEDMGALDDRFERFALINGPYFFGFGTSKEIITLERREWKVTQPFVAVTDTPSGNSEPMEEATIPFRLGETVRWSLVS